MLPPGRRTFLGQLAAGFGGAWLTLSRTELLAIHDHARQAATAVPRAFKILTAVEAADVEAMAAEIIPSDGTPGAVEAHVVHFIDHILSTIGKDDDRPVYVTGLAMLQDKTREMFPGTARFSSLAREHRFEVLAAVVEVQAEMVLPRVPVRHPGSLLYCMRQGFGVPGKDK